MAQRLTNPFLHWVNSAGDVYAGGFLYFYESGTSTPLDTYNDPDLAAPHANSNPLTLNSAGRPSVPIYLKNQLYTVVLKDSSLNTVWTADNVSTTDFSSVIVTKVGSGSPSGLVAGTAGSSSVLPTMYWDYTNSILYVCTTTGVAATAAWTALNASAATPVVVAPQGYLTPTSATIALTSDVTAGTALYYTPYVGNLVPVYNGSRFVPTEFAELTLTLHSSHATNTIYDVFEFSNAGVVTIGTGPAWTTSTAGSGARGTGAGTTQLTRLNGYYVNAVQITARNGTTTYTVAANYGVYLGSIFIDGSAGQITCHVAYGQSRKWAVWNAYNRRRLFLKGGDSTASWTYNSATVRASNNDSANKVTTFCGLPEEWITALFSQRLEEQVVSVTGSMQITIGVNSTTSASGFAGLYQIGAAASTISGACTVQARHLVPPGIGINNLQMQESAPAVNGTETFYGQEGLMLMTAEWMG